MSTIQVTVHAGSGKLTGGPSREGPDLRNSAESGAGQAAPKPYFDTNAITGRTRESKEQIYREYAEA